MGRREGPGEGRGSGINLIFFILKTNLYNNWEETRRQPFTFLQGERREEREDKEMIKTQFLSQRVEMHLIGICPLAGPIAVSCHYHELPSILQPGRHPQFAIR